MALKIRFVKNHQVNIIGNPQIRLHVRQARMIQTSAAKLHAQFTGEHALTHDVNMDEVFEVTLPRMTPKEIKRRPEHSDAFFERLLDAEMTNCIERRAEAQLVLEQIARLCDPNNVMRCLEVVEDTDGLLSGEDYVSDAERELAGLPAKEKTSIASAAEAAMAERVASSQAKNKGK